MVGELATFSAAVSSGAKFVLGHSPKETFWVEVVNELIAKFWKQEERRSHLERSDARVCDLILRPPTGRARLRVEQAARQEADADLEALRTSSSWVQELVLDGADGPSSLVVSLSRAAKLLEGHVGTEAANGGSTGGPSRRWLWPCHTFQSWDLSWS
jgi:hypothetical protein